MTRLTEDEKRSRHIGVGMAIAAGIIADHDPVYAEEILRAAGLDDRKACRRIGVDGYDMKLLRHVLSDMERKDRNTATRRDVDTELAQQALETQP